MKLRDTVHFEGEDMTIAEWLKLVPGSSVIMTFNESGGLDVMDNTGKVIGVMTVNEAQAFLLNEGGRA